MNTIPFNWKTADFHHCVRADSIVYEPKRNKTALQSFKISDSSEVEVSTYLLYVAQGLHANRPYVDFRFVPRGERCLVVYRAGDYMGRLTWRRVDSVPSVVIESRNISRNRLVDYIQANQTYTSDLDKAVIRAQDTFTQAKPMEIYRELEGYIGYILHDNEKHPLLFVHNAEWETPLKEATHRFEVTEAGLAAELLYPLLKHFTSEAGETSWMDDEQDWMGNLKKMVSKIPTETVAQFTKGFERVRDGRDMRIRIKTSGHWLYKTFNGSFRLFTAGEGHKKEITPPQSFASASEFPENLSLKYEILKMTGMGVRVPEIGTMIDTPGVAFGEIFHIEGLDVKSMPT